MPRQLTISMPLAFHVGYGQLALEVFRGLTSRGFDIRVKSMMVDQRFEPVPEDVVYAASRRDIDPIDRLVIGSPNYAPDMVPGGKLGFFTMWETTRMFPDHAANLNKASLVITPCHFCRDTFEDSGVGVPIEVVPLGINPDVFNSEGKQMGDTFIVGASGKITHGGVRKMIHEGVEAFREAFPDEQDVQMWVKCHPDDNVELLYEAVNFDPRIHVMADHWKEADYAAWLKRISVFLSVSRSEGWGLIQHQAAAVGTPMVGPINSGLSEFLNCHTSFRAKAVTEMAAKPIYQGIGRWFKADKASVVAQLRRAKNDKAIRAIKSFNGAQHVKQFTWERSIDRLVDALDKSGFAKP